MVTITLTEEELVAVHSILTRELTPEPLPSRYTPEETNRLARHALGNIRGKFTREFWRDLKVRERLAGIDLAVRGDRG